jgi:hypothetical protein
VTSASLLKEVEELKMHNRELTRQLREITTVAEAERYVSAYPIYPYAHDTHHLDPAIIMCACGGGVQEWPCGHA